MQIHRWHVALWLLVILTLIVPRALVGGPRRGRRLQEAPAHADRVCGWDKVPAGPESELPATSQECSDPEEEDEEQRIAPPALPLLILDATPAPLTTAERPAPATTTSPTLRLRC